MDAETSYNINADTAAAKLAEALNAEKLILLTDVRGLLRDPRDENTLIHVVHTYDVPGLIAGGIISGGMRAARWNGTEWSWRKMWRTTPMSSIFFSPSGRY